MGRCSDSPHCAPIAQFGRRTGLDPSAVGRYAWVHIGPIGAAQSVVAVHWSDQHGPLDSRVISTRPEHASHAGYSLDLLGLAERPHARAQRLQLAIDGDPLVLYVVVKVAWREPDGCFAAWYAHPSGVRIQRVSDEHALTRDERGEMMHFEDLLLGHVRPGRKPRDADRIDAAEVDVWLAARAEHPRPTFKQLADRYHRNADTIRQRCREREQELAREQAHRARSSLPSPVIDYVRRVHVGTSHEGDPDGPWRRSALDGREPRCRPG